MPISIADLSHEIQTCFQWNSSHSFSVEVFDKEFEDFVEVEDNVDIPDKTRVRVRLKSSSSPIPSPTISSHSSPSSPTGCNCSFCICLIYLKVALTDGMG